MAVMESTKTVGRGILVLSGRVPGHAAFRSQVPDGTTINYCIRDYNGSFEIGTGVYTAGTLTRNVREKLEEGAYRDGGPPIHLTGHAVVEATAYAGYSTTSAPGSSMPVDIVTPQERPVLSDSGVPGILGSLLSGGSKTGGISVLSSSGMPSDTITGFTSPQRLLSWHLPAGAVGPHDVFLFWGKMTNSNSANAKYLQLFINEEEVAQFQNTTTASATVLWSFAMRGSLSSEIGMRLNSAGVGATAGGFATKTVDLSEGFELSVRGWTLTSTSESMRIEQHTLLHIRGAE